MHRYRRSTVTALCLVISVAFNIGISTALVMQLHRDRSGSANEAESILAEALSSIAPAVRHHTARGAELSHELVTLITAAHPDNSAISTCLDEISKTRDATRQLIVDSILSEVQSREGAVRSELCREVHLRMCGLERQCAGRVALGLNPSTRPRPAGS